MKSRLFAEGSATTADVPHEEFASDERGRAGGLVGVVDPATLAQVAPLDRGRRPVDGVRL
jgi:hypothetical protein